MGKKTINSEKSIALRDYHVWEQKSSGKLILITVLTPKKGTFPDGIEWVDRKSAIYSHRNVVAYTDVHERPAGVIRELGASLPECLIIAQEFYFHEKEVLYKALIVPDEMCAEVAEPVVQELNRVANMQP